MPNVVSQKILNANRRNAAKSTGPTSPQGKDRASQNAIRHGFFAKRTVIISGDVPEDQAEFDALLEQFYADFQPANAFECACVERMASACWRTRRAYQFEVASLENANICYRSQTHDRYLPGEKDSDRLVRYESMLDRQFFRAHQRLMSSRLAMQQAAALLAHDHLGHVSPAPDARASASHSVSLPPQEEVSGNIDTQAPIPNSDSGESTAQN
jgi:hypothetical protein